MQVDYSFKIYLNDSAMENAIIENAIAGSANINHLTDFGFKRFFGTEAYKKNLILFLNAFLRERQVHSARDT